MIAIADPRPPVNILFYNLVREEPGSPEFDKALKIALLDERVSNLNIEKVVDAIARRELRKRKGKK